MDCNNPACGCDDPEVHHATAQALPHVACGTVIQDVNFASFYHICAAVACRSQTTDPTIMRVRLEMIRQSYERDIVSPMRLSSSRPRPDVPTRALEPADLSAMPCSGDARPIGITVE